MNLLGPWSELNLPQMRRILSRRQGTPTEAIGIWVLWRNTEGGLKDKQMDNFILIMGLPAGGIKTKIPATLGCRDNIFYVGSPART